MDSTHARHIAEGLVLVEGTLVCRMCAHEIGPATENYKLQCAMTERPLKAVNPHLLDPKTYVDDKIVFRNYACPSCGLLIQTELARPTDPPLWDIQLAF
jgi:acetone carboxylase gamma subunit